jgi:hypothetical protein
MELLAADGVHARAHRPHQRHHKERLQHLPATQQQSQLQLSTVSRAVKEVAASGGGIRLPSFVVERSMCIGVL